MPSQTASTAHTLHNIELIRFVLALIVLMSHSSNFLGVDAVGSDGFVSHPSVILSASRILLNGPAAVMMFFIISGVCIHAPYRGGHSLELTEFYTRRYVRIIPPLLVSWALSALIMGDNINRFPVWSLYCEVVYYLIFPILLIIIGQIGFLPVFMLSALASLGICITPDLHDGQPWTYGGALTWVLYLPVWLSGIAISEFAHYAGRWPNNLRTGRAMGAAAFGLVLLGAGANYAQIHLANGPHYKVSLLLFSAPAAVFIFLILSTDLSRSRICSLLARQGAWSYSLYLVHTALTVLLMRMLYQAGVTHFTPLSSLLIYGLLIAYVLTYAWGFHCLIERPSRLLAKRLGQRAGITKGLTVTSPAIKMLHLPTRNHSLG